MKLRKLIAILILIFILLNNIAPILTFAVENTDQEEIDQEYDEEDDDDQEIGEEYEIKSEETWDVSKNEDGSVIAKWTFKDKTITISGNGDMRTYNKNSLESLKKYKNIIEKVVIESNITYIGNYIFGSSLKEVKVIDNNQKYISIDGILYNKAKTKLIRYPAKKEAESFIIPNSVTSLDAYAFSQCCNLTNITIQNGVKEIGIGTFNQCESLKQIEIPNSVTNIGNYAFEGCSSLVNISIPSSVTEIENGVFSKCESLTSISIPNSVTSIGEYAFDDCISLVNINIPSSVTEIGDGAFYGCESLTSISIPNNVTNIGNYVFFYCISLENIDIPNSVTSIGEDAFDSCSGLKYINVGSNNKKYTGIDGVLYNKEKTQIIVYPAKKEQTNYVIPETITSINAYAFFECNYLTNLKIPNSVKSIGPFAFEGCNNLRDINIGSGVKSIENGAFANCCSLKSITIPSSVTSINDNAFYEWNGLIICKTNSEAHRFAEENNKYYLLTDEVESQYEKEYEIKSEETWDVSENQDGSVIAKWTFNDRTLRILGSGEWDGRPWYDTYKKFIEKVVIENGITRIENSAFYHCSSLTSIEIPNSVTEIGGYAFVNCSSLISVEIPNSVVSIRAQAFEGCSNLKRINIPSSIRYLGWRVFNQCDSLEEINVDPDNEIYESIDGVLYDKELEEVLKCPSKKAGESCIIKDGVTSIGYAAFRECKNLKRIVIPSSVDYIAKNAFEHCSSLTTINLPNNLTEIEDDLFLDCSNLKNINIPSCATTIGRGAFYGCSSLTSINIPDSVTEIGRNAFAECNNLTSINIPNKVTNIGELAFCKCSNLTSINIPNSVTSIGAQAFQECTSLKSINISKSVESIGENVFLECSNLEQINVDKNNREYSSIDGVLYNKDKTRIIKYPSKKEESKYVVENSTTDINVYAFERCENLKSVVLPSSIKNISSNSFYRWDELIVCENNSYAQKFAEKNGRIYTFDEEPPEAIFTPSDFSRAKKDVNIKTDVVDYKSGVDENSLKYVWSTKEQVTKEEITTSFKNGEEIASQKGVTGIYYLYIYAKDIFENEVIIKQAVILDNILPQLDVSYSEEKITKQDVVVTITTNEEVQNVEGWTLSSNGKALSKKYTQNTEETIIVKDIAGNEVEKKVKITNIDKDAPRVTGVIDGGIYSNRATPVVEDENLESVRLLKKEKIQNEQTGEEEIKENEVENYHNGDEITDFGDYKIIATDKVGNTTIVEFGIKYVVLNGDLNENSKIDIGDILMLNRHMSQANNNDIYEKHPDWRLSEQKILSGDLNGNKIIDIGDVLKLRRYMAAQNNNEVATKHPDWLNL